MGKKQGNLGADIPIFNEEIVMTLEIERHKLVHSIWAVLPPVITIILALATKEVYTSLFTGVLVGSFMYSGFNIIGTIDTVFKVMNDKIGGNVYILMFMVMLGIFVAAVNKSGAS